MKAEYEVQKEKEILGVITDGNLNIEFMELNLSSLKSTKKFIDDFKSSGRKLHALICNAGIALHEQGMCGSGKFKHNRFFFLNLTVHKVQSILLSCSSPMWRSR